MPGRPTEADELGFGARLAALRVELLERFQREDIAWALQQKASEG